MRYLIIILVVCCGCQGYHSQEKIYCYESLDGGTACFKESMIDAIVQRIDDFDGKVTDIGTGDCGVTTVKGWHEIGVQK